MPEPSGVLPGAVFVYGTLRPGEVRWTYLEPFAVDLGWDDAVPGTLFDTGRGYPAAVFGDGGSTITGRTVPLLGQSTTQALELLDRVEGSVWGLYRRVIVTTAGGTAAWAYEYGDLDEAHTLTPIVSGDWLARS